MMSATSAASASGVSVSVTAVAGGGGGGTIGGATGAGCGLSVSVAAASAGLLAVASACTTPRTPEILNSLIAMSNPLDEYPYNGNDKRGAAGYKSGSPNDSNSNSNSSPASSPATGTPPSVQKTCSDLIKAGLKLSIESKRKLSGSDSADAPGGCLKKLKKEEPAPSDEDYDSGHTQTSRSEGLTPEDEERRRRRRERNKIAATKCRLKKRERTVNLVSESEVLENQNFDLKSQIKELEVQRLQLVEMLNIHTSSCMKNGNSTSPTTPYNNVRQPYDSPNNYQTASTTSYDTNSPYIRPESANILASSYTCHTPAINNDNAVYENSSNLNTNTQHLDNLDINVNSPYITNQQHIIDTEYHRPDSAMHASNVSDVNYGGPDNYLQKPNLLIIEPSDNDYSEQMSNYDNAEFHMAQQMSVNRQQQCHNFNNGNSEVPNKLNSNSLNNGCLA